MQREQNTVPIVWENQEPRSETVSGTTDWTSFVIFSWNSSLLSSLSGSWKFQLDITSMWIADKHCLSVDLEKLVLDASPCQYFFMPTSIEELIFALARCAIAETIQTSPSTCRLTSSWVISTNFERVSQTLSHRVDCVLICPADQYRSFGRYRSLVEGQVLYSPLPICSLHQCSSTPSLS